MLRSALFVTVLTSSVIYQGPSTPPVYDATFVVAESQTYTGTTTFAVDGKGAVTGKMQLTQPLGVTAQLAGVVKDGAWTIEYPYTITERNCSGTVKGTGKISADKKSVTGSVVVSGDCSPAPQNATFTLTRQPPKTKIKPGR